MTDMCTNVEQLSRPVKFDPSELARLAADGGGSSQGIRAVARPGFGKKIRGAGGAHVLPPSAATSFSKP
jgi:hypothetical protein